MLINREMEMYDYERNDSILWFELKKCDAYIATISDDQLLRAKTAALWSKLNNAPIYLEHINCQEC